ncbi:MAG: hypothetical protein MR051_07205 [Lentisphaeria bacterium]|nr:hypothetical protein [Lentisphaeria bacterium]
MFRRIIVSFLACAAIGAAAAGDCPVIPRPRTYRADGDAVALPTAEKMAIVVAPKPHEVVTYAAERLQKTLFRLTGRQIAIAETVPENVELIIRMGLPECEADLAAACGKAGIDISPASWGYDGFVIHFTPGQVHLAAAEPRALIYAQEVLCAMIKREGDRHLLTVAEVRDHAGIRWRSYSWNSCQWYNDVNLDAYADARMNCIELRDGFAKDLYGHYGYPYNYPITGENERKVIAAAHRRGMFVWGVVACAAAPENHPQVVGQVEKLIALGVDGVYISYDDPGKVQGAEALIRQIVDTAKKHGIAGERIAFLPPYPDYAKFYSDFNLKMLQSVPELRDATWFLTASPSPENLAMLKDMGIRKKFGWFFNWPMGNRDAPAYQRPFFFERAYLPLGDFDDFDRGMDWLDDEMLARADRCLSSAMVWTREYPETLAQFFGAWAWNPGAASTRELRKRAYTRLYGAELADAAAEFDRYLTGVNHNLSFIGDDFWTKCLWRLRDVRNRRHVNHMLAKMKPLAARIVMEAPSHTWIDREHLQKEYLIPMQKTVAWLERLVNTRFPEEIVPDFDRQSAQSYLRLKRADFLREQRKKLVPVLNDIECNFGRQRHVPQYLKKWRNKLEIPEK